MSKDTFYLLSENIFDRNENLLSSKGYFSFGGNIEYEKKYSLKGELILEKRYFEDGTIQYIFDAKNPEKNIDIEDNKQIKIIF